MIHKVFLWTDDDKVLRQVVWSPRKPMIIKHITISCSSDRIMFASLDGEAFLGKVPKSKLSSLSSSVSSSSSSSLSLASLQPSSTISTSAMKGTRLFVSFFSIYNFLEPIRIKFIVGPHPSAVD